MKRSRPVFIVGAARSGTSILYRTLQKHSVFKPKKINLTEVQIFKYTNRSYLFENEEGSATLDYMLNNRKAYKQFLTTIKKIQLMHRAVRIIFGYKSINLRLADQVQLWWYLNFNHLVLRSFFYFAEKARESNRLVEKSPNNLRYAIKNNGWKRIVLVWDNASYHISKITSEYVIAQKKDWLIIIYLPKRAPYLNPNERKVNQCIKSDVCANRFYTSIEEQKDAISEYLDKRFGRWSYDIHDDT